MAEVVARWKELASLARDWLFAPLPALTLEAATEKDPLPTAVREWTEFAAGRSDLSSGTCITMDPATIRRNDGEFVVATMQDRPIYWAIRAAQARERDPEVVMRNLTPGAPAARSAGVFTVFAAGRLAFELTNQPRKDVRGDFWGRIDYSEPNSMLALFEAQFTRMSFGFTCMDCPNGCAIVFWRAGGLVARAHFRRKDRPELFVLGTTGQSWDQATEIVKRECGGWGDLFRRGKRGAWKRDRT